MQATRQINLDRGTYIWDGSRWYHTKTFLTPPTVDVLKLNMLLLKALEEEDLAIVDVESLVARAQEARDALQYRRMGLIAERILDLEPGYDLAAEILCSALRLQNRPAQALKATQRMKDTPNAPLLVARAAALCDLEKWQEALEEIKRAQAVGAGKLATPVVKRIRSGSGKPAKSGTK
ncbi:MAG: CDC27 family protein [Syntrophobacteraceae bacterium]|jgi:tetratricopeptide (TPR) repeat protein|nr:CDC27 family protein [Syntrophobacteraceae bacterium]